MVSHRPFRGGRAWLPKAPWVGGTSTEDSELEMERGMCLVPPRGEIVYANPRRMLRVLDVRILGVLLPESAIDRSTAFRTSLLLTCASGKMCAKSPTVERVKPNTTQ